MRMKTESKYIKLCIYSPCTPNSWVVGIGAQLQITVQNLGTYNVEIILSLVEVKFKCETRMELLRSMVWICTYGCIALSHPLCSLLHVMVTGHSIFCGHWL